MLFKFITVCLRNSCFTFVVTHILQSSLSKTILIALPRFKFVTCSKHTLNSQVRNFFDKLQRTRLILHVKSSKVNVVLYKQYFLTTYKNLFTKHSSTEMCLVQIRCSTYFFLEYWKRSVYNTSSYIFYGMCQVENIRDSKGGRNWYVNANWQCVAKCSQIARVVFFFS